MKQGLVRYLALTLLLLFTLSVFSNALAASFDINAFSDAEVFEIEIDDMDDTGEISLKNGGSVFGTLTFGSKTIIVIGDVDIKITEDFPPVIRISLLTMGDKACYVDKVILKPSDTRYTLEVSGDREYEDGTIFEVITLVITDQSIGLLTDIISNETGSVKIRLVGTNTMDGTIYFNCEGLKTLYDAYIKSGALKDYRWFTLDKLFTWEIK